VPNEQEGISTRLSSMSRAFVVCKFRTSKSLGLSKRVLGSGLSNPGDHTQDVSDERWTVRTSDEVQRLEERSTDSARASAKLLYLIIRLLIRYLETSTANCPIPLPAPPSFFSTMSKIPKSTFTATGVWSHMKPGQRATTLKFAEPAPKNETPQQKVKRLREAANQAKMAQITRWDYMYLYGRIAADTAHRLTVYGIVFATGTAPSSRP
jgi:hypothetical protein